MSTYQNSLPKHSLLFRHFRREKKIRNLTAFLLNKSTSSFSSASMLKNLMEGEDKRLNLDAPLLSVRRFGSEPEPEPAPPSNPHPKRSHLPFYRSDLKTGPIRNPGVVPFLWEQSPGRPKSAPAPPLHVPQTAPKLPPGRILAELEPPVEENNTETKKVETLASRIEEEDEEEEVEDGEEFCDALETLSRTDSFFMNCSVSGLSEAAERREREPSGSFSTDPQVRDFMMGRFLPAAKAMATGAPQSSSRRRPPPVPPAQPARVVDRDGNREQRRVRFPMDYQHGVGYDCEEEEEEEEDDCFDESGQLGSKACGLIPKFCFKSSFCLLNPVPGMKVGNGRLPATSVRRIRSPQVKGVQHGSIGSSEEEDSWEAVYKHKLVRGNSPPQCEDLSKLTSESNRLTYWSDSPTADGSSPNHHSNSGGVSPYRNEPSQSPFHEGKGFLGVPTKERKGSKSDNLESFEKDSENYWVVTPHNSSQFGSGSLSPAVETACHVDNVHVLETPNSKSSSQDASPGNEVKVTSADQGSEVGTQSQRIDERIVLETHVGDALQSKFSEIVEIGQAVCMDTSNGAMHKNNGLKPSNSGGGLFSLKHDDQVKNDVDFMSPLLPPPLPNSPSESWLSRALPSVSSKNPSGQSFLGMQVQSRKQASNPPSIVHKKETAIKHVKVLRQTRFADMLANPLSPHSDI